MFKPNQAKSEPTGWGGHSCLPTLVGVADKNVDTTSDWSGLVQNVAEARLNPILVIAGLLLAKQSLPRTEPTLAAPSFSLDYPGCHRRAMIS